MEGEGAPGVKTSALRGEGPGPPLILAPGARQGARRASSFCLGESPAAEEHAATEGIRGVPGSRSWAGVGADGGCRCRLSGTCLPWRGPRPPPALSVEVANLPAGAHAHELLGVPRALGLAGSPFAYSSPRGGGPHPAPGSSSLDG